MNETVDVQHPMVLASGNEAVAGIADKLLKMSPSMRAFLRLRFYYETDVACAQKVGISPTTIRQWKAKDVMGFDTAYKELLTQPLLHARAELLLLSQKAIHTIGELMDSPNPQTRLAAAEKVLKGRDSQLVSTNVKVESGDGGDLYTALLTRLANAKAARVLESREPAGDTIDAEFREVSVDGGVYHVETPG